MVGSSPGKKSSFSQHALVLKGQLLFEEEVEEVADPNQLGALAMEAMLSAALSATQER